jgi:sugar phosphate isomerase/epimerase
MSKFSFILLDTIDSSADFEPFGAALQKIKEVGFGGVELNLSGPPGHELDSVSRLVESLDLPVVSFLSGTNYFREGLCLSSPRSEIRERAVARLQAYTLVAARFGAVLVIGQMQGFASDEPDRAVGEARIAESLKPVVESAERHGASIAFEPVNHLQAGFHNTLADVVALAARLGSPRFRPMLDSFHMNIEEKSMIEPILRVGRDLAHFHLCESNGGLLGTGHFDIKSLVTTLNQMGYVGYISTKVYRVPYSTAAPATAQFLRGLNLLG